MSYYLEHYPVYVPPHISGTEEVRITIKKLTPTEEMEQRIRMRFAFAMSSFGRMFNPSGITLEMRALCNEWSKIEEQPPIGDLYLVDRYFLELWKKRNESKEEN
tara:strand:- start:5758 stop:6069 length:312 start_codon:yes stop_codon:yes gene_type:complete